jgi:hypothetical protein
MTELERARAHLRDSQENLSWRRFQQQHGKHPADWHALRWAEDVFLAALSWVWQEQEREREMAVREWMTEQLERPVRAP